MLCYESFAILGFGFGVLGVLEVGRRGDFDFLRGCVDVLEMSKVD